MWSPDDKSGGDCDSYCKYVLDGLYDGGTSVDLPPRCRCYKHENRCQSNLVDSKTFDSYFKGEKKRYICYYDVCEITGESPKL